MDGLANRKSLLIEPLRLLIFGLFLMDDGELVQALSQARIPIAKLFGLGDGNPVAVFTFTVPALPGQLISSLHGLLPLGVLGGSDACPAGQAEYCDHQRVFTRVRRSELDHHSLRLATAGFTRTSQPGLPDKTRFPPSFRYSRESDFLSLTRRSKVPSALSLETCLEDRGVRLDFEGWGCHYPHE